MLNKLLINDLINSILIEKIIPIKIPKIVDNEPIKKPTRKNIFVIDEFLNSYRF